MLSGPCAAPRTASRSEQGSLPRHQYMGYYLILYFLAGVLQDFLVTLNWRFVSKERVIPAAIFSFTVTVVSILVLYNIITKLDEERSLIAIVIYALGVGTGTILGMGMKISPK